MLYFCQPLRLFQPPRLLNLEIFTNLPVYCTLRVYYFDQNLPASPFIPPCPSILRVVQAIIRHQNFLLTSRDLPTVALSDHVKIRVSLTSGAFFPVNWYQCITENKITKAFFGCKSSKPHQSFTDCCEKLGSSGSTPRHTEYQKSKKENKIIRATQC